MKVIKKDGQIVEFDGEKIINAINKSSKKVGEVIDSGKMSSVLFDIYNELKSYEETGVSVDLIHKIVINKLKKNGLETVSNSYRVFREFKTSYMGKIIDDTMEIMDAIDRSNSNNNTKLIATKRTEVAKNISKGIYKELFLSPEVNSAINDGYIYLHDLSDLILKQFNCCLIDVGNIMDGGFNVDGYFYKEPKNIKVAVGQLSDIMLIESSNHFGGLTVPQVDKVLAKYYKMEYERVMEQLLGLVSKYGYAVLSHSKIIEDARKIAYDNLKQSLQGLEIKMNTVGSSRGGYPFTTFTFGDIDNEWEYDVCRAILEVRMEGHGKDGFKKTCIFPKLVFLYNTEKNNNDDLTKRLFDISLKCSSQCMYPDYLSDASHKHEGKWCSGMGCRAYLSNYKDLETGEMIFEGRGNLGAIALNLPMIYMKAKEENKDFYEVLDYYMEMIRELLNNRYEYVGKAHASSNPLMFMEGGAYGGNLKEDEIIAPLLKSWTASFGITALNELCVLKNGKSIAEDNSFAVDVMKFINEKVDKYKEEDNHPYAIYGVPAETLCKTQVVQFREKYGIIKGVSDREYFSNSFHCHVTEEISPFEKQDKERELFHMLKGGHIQYVRISDPTNISGIKNIIKRGMELGFYQGVNFNACTCEKCGATGTDWGEYCPHCGSTEITEINRISGYMGFSRRGGDRTINDGKMAEIKERMSM